MAPQVASLAVSRHSLRYAIATDLAKASKLPPHLRAIEVDEMLVLVNASVSALEEVRYEALEELVAKGHDLASLVELTRGHFDGPRLKVLMGNGRARAKEQRNRRASRPSANSE
jgi:site-specific recombinase XerC